jgi:hypothetical protein
MFVLALVLLAPLTLGPAIGPVTRALGGQPVHRCACGMVRGTCGCPECERLERQRESDKTPTTHSVLKSNCSDDDAPVVFTPLPIAAPQSVALALPKPAVALATLTPARIVHSLDRNKPPTPPPETAVLRT